jgi:hypothetical protein
MRNTRASAVRSTGVFGGVGLAVISPSSHRHLAVISPSSRRHLAVSLLWRVACRVVCGVWRVACGVWRAVCVRYTMNWPWE